MEKVKNPPTMQWEMTAECNHDCVHCYNYWRKDFEKIAGMSKTKTKEEYLEIARKIVELQPVSVTITGGEPLIVFNEIKPSIELLCENGIVATMNTNAALLNEEICKYLIEKEIRLFVSFISAEPEVFDKIANRKGAFERVVEKLDLAYDLGVKFNNNIVVSTKNLQYVGNTIDFLKERYDTDYVSITRVGKPINSDDSFNSWLLSHEQVHELLDIVVEKSKKYPDLTIGTGCPFTPCSINSQEAFDIYGYKKICTAGKTNFTIDTDGNYKACARDSRLYGNILVDDFTEVYERMREWRDGSFVPKECHGCKEFQHCLGGCRVDAIPFTGRSDCLDSISDPAALPLRFNFKSRERNFDGMLFAYDKDNVISVKNSDTSYRVSCKKNYVIITDKLYDYLVSHNSFSSYDLASQFGKERALINNVIARLLAEKIICRVA